MNPELIKAKVINRQMLTDDVMELTIETQQEVKSLPGQWALFVFEDQEGEFQSAFSVLDQDTDNEKTMLIFAIKLSNQGRVSTALRNLHIGNDVAIKGIYGTFLLQDTVFPKVFIGTSIGIVPLLNMAKYCMTDKDLFFSVPTKNDLFYEDRIKRIHGLGYKIHLTKESRAGYEHGRIDPTQWNFPLTTEFYVCGKPETVEDIISKLTLLGYQRIYSENF